jgi:hypothetical protein
MIARQQQPADLAALSYNAAELRPVAANTLLAALC